MNEEIKQKKRKLRGAVTFRHEDCHYKPKHCKQCGMTFQPIYPAEMFCSKECQKLSESNSDWKHKYMKRKMQTYYAKRTKVKRCRICGKELQDHRQFVHYDCVVKEILKGNITKQIKSYVTNHGLSMKEIREEYKGV